METIKLSVGALCLYLLILIFASCRKESNVEFVDLQDKDWFKTAMLECDNLCCTCRLGINKGLYNGEIVYYVIKEGGALCDVFIVINLYNVDGLIENTYTAADGLKDFDSEVEFVESIFVCEY